MVEIFDCRHKEKLVTRRVGGDFEIAILDLEGNIKFQCWFQMRQPYNQTAKALETLLEEFKCLLKRQEK